MANSERKRTIYKTITGWKLDTHLSSIPGSNRQIAKLILGDISYHGSIEEYITEDIYKDLLDNILNNPKEYKVTVQLGNVPQLTVTLDGLLIPHNHMTATYIEEITELIKQLPKDDVIDAYLEMRLNMNGQTKLKGASSLLMSLIEKRSHKKYAIPFVRTAICQFIEETYYFTGTDIKDTLRSMDYPSLIQCINEIIRYKMTGKIEDEFLKEAVNSSSKEEKTVIKEIELLAGKETLLRLYKGTLQQR